MLPVGHRRLAMALAAIVLFLILFFLWAVPQEKQLNDRLEALERQEEENWKQPWPSDLKLLQRQLEMAKVEWKGNGDAPGMIQVTTQVLDQATAYFQKRLLEKFDSAESFMLNATRLDYKDLYDRVSMELKGMGVKLAPMEDSSGLPVYQLIGKLWAIQRIVQLASENHLTVLKKENGESEVKAFSPWGYKITEEEEQPYLIEFPVKIQLQGTHQQFVQFLDALQSKEDFLPIKRLMVYSVPPVPPKGSVETLRFHVLCSAFLAVKAKDSSQEP